MFCGAASTARESCTDLARQSSLSATSSFVQSEKLSTFSRCTIRMLSWILRLRYIFFGKEWFRDQSCTPMSGVKGTTPSTGRL